MTRDTVNRRLAHYCASCAVGLHDDCVTLLSPDATCLCEAEGHTSEIHPAIKGTVWQKSRSVIQGPMRDVDYEEEPYEVRGPGGVSETHVTKSKPRDDRDQAREDRLKTEERQAARAAMPWRF
jgi:hypothetical protein